MENESLILDLLESLAPTGRSYEDVMFAWRTSCPRLSIWEDALQARFVVVRNRTVLLTAAGKAFLTARRGSGGGPHLDGAA